MAYFSVGNNSHPHLGDRLGKRLLMTAVAAGCISTITNAADNPELSADVWAALYVEHAPSQSDYLDNVGTSPTVVFSQQLALNDQLKFTLSERTDWNRNDRGFAGHQYAGFKDVQLTWTAGSKFVNKLQLGTMDFSGPVTGQPRSASFGNPVRRVAGLNNNGPGPGLDGVAVLGSHGDNLRVDYRFILGTADRLLSTSKLGEKFGSTCDVGIGCGLIVGLENTVRSGQFPGLAMTSQGWQRGNSKGLRDEQRLGLDLAYSFSLGKLKLTLEAESFKAFHYHGGAGDLLLRSGAATATYHIADRCRGTTFFQALSTRGVFRSSESRLGQIVTCTRNGSEQLQFSPEIYISSRDGHLGWGITPSISINF